MDKQLKSVYSIEEIGERPGGSVEDEGWNYFKQSLCSSQRFDVHHSHGHPSPSAGPVYFGAVMGKTQIDPANILLHFSPFQASALRPVDWRLWSMQDTGDSAETRLFAHGNIAKGMSQITGILKVGTARKN